MIPMGSRILNGRVALVTGASKGIGAAIARELAEQGAHIVANYCRCGERAVELVEEIKANGVEAVAVQTDVSHFEEACGLILTAKDHFGRVDILVNNAGITRDKTFKNMTEKEWREVMAVNLDSVFNCTSAVLPMMLESGFGRIVNISSIIGQSGGFGQVNYSASKAGMIGFTKSLALELARTGITVNAVCPGFIETEMVTSLSDKVRSVIRERIPMRRFGSTDEVAKGVAYLVSLGDYVTGQTLNINGGLYM